MCFKKRCTVFAGAGLSISIGGCISSTLTTHIRSIQQTIPGPGGTSYQRPFINEVATVLDTYFGQPCNFEDIFHTLEILGSCVHAHNPRTAKQFKPHFLPFFTANAPTTGSWFDPITLIVAKEDLLRAVGNAIEAYENNFQPNGSHNWYASFWRQLKSKLQLDVAILNYDNTIESSLEGIARLEDGYGFSSPSTNYTRFDPYLLINSRRSKIFHLHGNIRFGHDPTHTNTPTQMYDDSFHDLFKFRTFPEAITTWFGRSGPAAQSGESLVGGPIITGLRKTDKLLSYPYTIYNSEFTKSVLNNGRLLILGYSFSDLHYNALLDKMSGLHGNKRRIVIITFYPNFDTDWHPDMHAWDWASAEMAHFVLRAFRQTDLPISFTPPDPLVSNDGCARVYFRGVEHAFRNHGQEVVDFLR